MKIVFLVSNFILVSPKHFSYTFQNKNVNVTVTHMIYLFIIIHTVNKYSFQLVFFKEEIVCLLF